MSFYNLISSTQLQILSYQNLPPSKDMGEENKNNSDELIESKSHKRDIRVKVYVLNDENGQWDDNGIGHVYIESTDVCFISMLFVILY